jgi:2-succinyl-5-enolpyruvyl-6-hydroxy-3-cyclohexene-1-carboxylate synthase
VNHGGFDLLWLASSMAVRYANLHLAPRPAAQAVLGNRGLNGIDGTIAAFLGACRATGGRGLCLIGDLALLHDATALTAAAGVRGAVVLLDDGGGAIFDFLPVAGQPDYRRLVRAEHAHDVAAIAGACGVPVVRCRSLVELDAALSVAAAGDRLHLIACDLRGGDAVAAHRAVLAAMRGISADRR